LHHQIAPAIYIALPIYAAPLIDQGSAVMATLTFIESTGVVHTVEASFEQTLMQIAVQHQVPGILAECGGSCSCGTCHAYMDPSRLAALPDISETEAFMLEIVPGLRPESRLCCQIPMQAAFDGMVIHLPSEQL
jgi:ferredoxin, 2Fe-2S